MGVPRNQPLSMSPVRESVERFVPELDKVFIDRRKIDEIAADLENAEMPLPEWRAPVFPSVETRGVTADDVIDFLFLGNSINFQFRDYESGDKFSAEYGGNEWEGAFAMWGCLKREYDDNPAILDGDTLADLSKSEVKQLFEPADGTEIPLLEERHRILNQVGEKLISKYENRFSNLVKQAEPRLYADGEGIVDRLVTDFSSFSDSVTVTLDSGKPHEVIFWKRAQLAAGMAYGRFYDQDDFQIEDPEAFTIFVDYNLPNVLRGLNAIEYSDDLAEKVDNQKMIEAGSREEVEIRAATVHVADELLRRLIEQRDDPLYAPHMDYKLFQMRDKSGSPVHVTRTTAY